MTLSQILTLVFFAIGGWFLSGFDSALTGDNKSADRIRRLVRTGISLLLISGFLFGPPIFMAVALLLAIVWGPCVAELCTRGFQNLTHGQDNRAFDPRAVRLNSDRLATLVKGGRYEEALALCERMKELDASSDLAMEAMLFRLYEEMLSEDRLLSSPYMEGIGPLLAQQELTAAEERLKQVLAERAQHLPATYLLMRLYARDLAAPQRANEVLQWVKGWPKVPPGFVDYAGRSIREWSGLSPRRQKTAEGIESMLTSVKSSPKATIILKSDNASVDELVAAGHLTSAIQQLEKGIIEHPQNFELRLKLAEVYAIHCDDIDRAARTLDKLRLDSAFKPEQLRLANEKISAWRRGRGN